MSRATTPIRMASRRSASGSPGCSDFDLLPRIKQIDKAKLYPADSGDRSAYPGLRAALTCPIRWERIAEQYDQMIKYATASRTRTASPRDLGRVLAAHA